MLVGTIEFYYHGRILCEGYIRYAKKGTDKLIVIEYDGLKKFFDDENATEIITKIFSKKFELGKWSGKYIAYSVDAVSIKKLWDKDFQSGVVKIDDITISYNLILKPKHVVLTEILVGAIA